MLLQGLDPNLTSYEAALALYKREVGQKPEKVCHFFSSTWFWKKVEKNTLNSNKSTHISHYLGAPLSTW